MLHQAALALLCAVALCGTASAQLRFVGYREQPYPTYMNVFNHTDETNPFRRFSVLLGSQRPEASTYDSTYVLLEPGQYAGNVSAIPIRTVYNFLYAPKEVQQVPRSVFGFDAVIHFDGATQLGKRRGAIYVTDIGDFNFPATYDISSGVAPGEWIYHTALWKFVNTDQRIDLLACRVQIDEGLIRFAELVWLEHPLQGINRNWQIRVLKDSSCDGNMATARFDIGLLQSYDAIFTTGRYTKRLTVFWSISARDLWDDPDNVLGGVIEGGREYHDVVTADINNDGKVDLLLSIGANEGGSVEVYEIPEDFREMDLYQNHVLASGFNSRNNGQEGRTPGVVRPFYPDSNHARKPWIYVAGADDGRAYFLRPASESPTDWTYTQLTIVDQGSEQHVAGIAAADVDGDGWTELFISTTTRDRLDIYTFRP